MTSFDYIYFALNVVTPDRLDLQFWGEKQFLHLICVVLQMHPTLLMFTFSLNYHNKL